VKRILFSVIAMLCLFGMGCANLNPRLDNKIDNQNGKIDEIKNNQNGVMLDLLKLKQSAEIQNSQVTAAIASNNNKGVQILQGSDPFVTIFGLATIGMVCLLFYFWQKSDTAEKTSEIMAMEVAKINNRELHDNILRKAMGYHIEEHVYRLLAKHK
jgi:hypothetical protein